MSIVAEVVQVQKEVLIKNMEEGYSIIGQFQPFGDADRKDFPENQMNKISDLIEILSYSLDEYKIILEEAINRGKTGEIWFLGGTPPGQEEYRVLLYCADGVWSIEVIRNNIS